MYVSKHTEYFSLEREMFKEAVTGENLKILDVGCGTGALGAFYEKNQNCKVYGIEINESAFLAAKEKLHEVIKGNVEVLDLPYENNYFDVVIMGDVLEHLINPVGTLNKMIVVLKPQGRIYITVPNVRYWRVVINLIFKDLWDYESWGILDYTHLRFYTKASIIKMLKTNNFKVKNTKWVIQKPSKSHLLNKITFRMFEGFLASHTFLEIEK
jgi:methionine biosynthesis protein MetW